MIAFPLYSDISYLKVTDLQKCAYLYNLLNYNNFATEN